MAVTGLQGLLALAYEDLELEARLKAPGADVVAIAAEIGFTITAEEFSQAMDSWEDCRLTSLGDVDL